ncbi:imidazole glycerol phosphate synthase subunit HisH [Pollutimonas thiosulfatoxidans]|nr:imidazole glycerol phosphate synthase subunit HisH [Pollutimonas thiosulfatoxidans]
MANLLNVARAFEYCGAEVKITTDAGEARRADRLVVPGVGAFEDSLIEIRDRGFDDAIHGFIGSERPLFGICVGMQMLFDVSDEFGEHAGLGVLPGRVRAVPNMTTNGAPQKVPHIGWNHLISPLSQRNWSDTLLHPYVGLHPAVYFVHSFSPEPSEVSHRLADCMYGGHRICAAVQHENIMATQFHPERSGKVGLLLLQRFMDL